MNPPESLATLDRALASPGISARHRARLLVLAARTRNYLGEVEEAGRVAATALAAASESGDNWAMGWALHVLALVTGVQGHMTDALPLFDRALTVTESDPALTDLRLLLQINKAVALGNLDRYEEALTAASQARQLAEQVGTAIRLAQAHGALGQLLFETGRWDDALAEVESLPENLKEPAVACIDLGIAAVIGFHRGETGAARRHLAVAVPHATRIGHRLIGRLAEARSLDREQDGALPEALAALTEAFDDNAEQLEETEDLLADAVRLAAGTGDLDTARTLAGHAETLAAESEIPHRQANALYCRGLLDHDGPRLLTAAQLYEEAGRRCSGPRPWRRPPGTSSTPTTASRRGPPLPPPSRSTTRWARRLTRPGSRPRSGPTASGAGRTPSTGGRRAAGTASRRPRSRSPRSWRRDCPTRRSRPGCCYPAGPLARTSPTSSRSSTSTRGST